MNLLKLLSAAVIPAMLAGCAETVPTAEKSGIELETSYTETKASESVSDETTQTAPVTETTAEVTDEKTTVPAETTSEEETDPIQKKLSEMTLREKVCQMFIVTPEQLSGYNIVTYGDEAVKESFADTPVGGIILFAQNLQSQSQTTELISDCQSCSELYSGTGLFIVVDEEGGTVARSAQKLGTASFNNMEYYGYMNDTQLITDVGSQMGADLAMLGFNVDFAPVADVNINSGNELGSRIFSSDPAIVSDMVSGFVQGLQSQGVCATLKHFPGLGAAGGNTHYDNSVYIYRTLDELRASEFVAFKGGIDAGADFVMVGHQIVSGIGDDLPADLSYGAVTELLRNELGFEGIAVTDAQQMNTIAGVYGSGEAAVRSVQAGIDIILMPADLNSAVDAVCTAVEEERISEDRIDESVMRILGKKNELGLFNEEE